MTGHVEAPTREVQINSWEPDHRRFQLSPGPATVARVRTYFYPLWKASSDGKPLVVRPADDGALLVQVPADTVKVDLKFEEPSRVRMARYLSAVGWFVIILLYAFRYVTAMFSKRQLAAAAVQ
jgi:hypothetical protein